MKELTFHYHLRLSMDAPVSGHRFTLRCIPVSDNRQRISGVQWQVSPRDFVSESRDQWGNALLYGCCQDSHTEFEVNVTGQATVGLAERVPGGSPERDRIFRIPTALTAPDAALAEFAAAFPETSDPLEAAEQVMNRVHDALVYAPGTTTFQTTAAQAFALGQGVCQDFSQVMLAVLRLRGIPARYAAGMLMGEGKSHAWVEVLHRGSWYAFDPTNRGAVTDQHIKLSHGRDAWDCAITRGLFRGSANQTTEISVVVTERKP